MWLQKKKHVSMFIICTDQPDERDAEAHTQTVWQTMEV
jgi:hypothetical protein